MPIQYGLYENHLTRQPGDFAALALSTGFSDREAIAERMLQMGTTVTKADILAVLENAEQAVVSLLLDGCRVQVGGLVELFPRVLGVFDGSDDQYDKNRHRLDVGANPGARVRREVRAKARTTKVAAGVPGPVVSEYRDLASGTRNETMTPGTIGTLRGTRLQFAPDKADEGIFVVPAEGGRALRIPPANMHKNKPSELVFLVPTGTIEPGDYVLEVRARNAKGGGPLRTSALDHPITVV
jgi:hypothetical protein